MDLGPARRFLGMSTDKASSYITLHKAKGFPDGST